MSTLTSASVPSGMLSIQVHLSRLRGRVKRIPRT
ncbi:TPA: hypothetical protein N0F65_007322 [Lagenidium giganteum]|uniref:Uncharacterized protein n=1 Tax=Lagenidium giganteum TaxID=4803 RepID=A0AAV2Z6G7_9STRA|nr:TPA: hypothetical protein N0F65_007322 [Lagenidium giganteum]